MLKLFLLVDAHSEMYISYKFFRKCKNVHLYSLVINLLLTNTYNIYTKYCTSLLHTIRIALNEEISQAILLNLHLKFNGFLLKRKPSFSLKVTRKYANIISLN